MKKVLLTLAVLAGLVSAAHAEYTWGELATGFKPHFSAIEGVSGIYGKNIEDGSNAGGFSDRFFTTGNGVLSLNVNWLNTNVSLGTKDVGAIGVGPAINFFHTIGFVFPEFSEKFRSYIPLSALPYTDKFHIGYAPSWNLNPGVREPFMHFITSGIDF